MKVKIKKLVESAVIPSYAKPGDCGMDLTATSINVERFPEYSQIEYGTGISVEIPEGYVGFLFPRSSVRNTDHMLSNSVGVIDSGYRGEIKFTFNSRKAVTNLYAVGERIGQIIILPYPQIEFEEVEELSETERGKEGFGSSGK